MGVFLMKIMVGYGTRPEVIKLAPVIRELQKHNVTVHTVFTGQHEDLIKDVYELVPPPDYALFCGGRSLTEMLNGIMKLAVKTYDCMIVQGDTVSAFALALSAFYQKTPVAHVEAGLRTWSLNSPWPEEGHRQMVDAISDYLYCPSMLAARNVDHGNVKPVIVGQTALDMIRITQGDQRQVGHDNTVLVTVHRREAFGKPIEQIFKTINNIAMFHEELEFIWPMHPNPEVQKHKHLLKAKNIREKGPLPYREMVMEMDRCKFAMTDSGGLQEELPYLGKRVVVLRPNTERYEAMIDGSCEIAGYTDAGIWSAFNEVNAHPVFDGECPYGDGHAAEHIVNHLLENL